MENSVSETGSEVSVEEFLSNVKAEDVIAAVNDSEPTAEHKENSGHNACGIPNELIAKHGEICNEMGRVKQQISELQEQYNTLKKAENALSLAMSLIGERCDAKSVTKLVKFYEKGE